MSELDKLLAEPTRKPLSHGKRTNEKELEDRIALLEREVKQLMAFVTSHGPAKPCPNDDDDDDSDDDYPSDLSLDSEDPENRQAEDDAKDFWARKLGDNATDGEDSEAPTVEMAPSSSKRLVDPEYLTKKPEKRRKLY